MKQIQKDFYDLFRDIFWMLFALNLCFLGYKIDLFVNP